MSEHLTDQEIQGYTTGQLTPEMLLVADDHLSSCELCRTKTADAIDVRKSVTCLTGQVGSPSRHISYQELSQWIDGQTDAARGIALRKHLEECELCATEEKDLRRFVLSRKADANVTRFSKSSLTLTWMQVAAVLAVIGTAGMILFWPLQKTINNLQSELQQSQSEMSELRKANMNQPAAILSLQDGGRQIVMDANGNLKGLPSSAADLIDPLKKRLKSLHLQIPTIPAELQPPKGKLLGSSNDSSFAPIQPYGAVVLSDTPEFSWRPLPNAKSYKIAIYDSQYQEVLRSDELTSPSWIVSTPLTRGKTYSWQVIAKLNGQEIIAPVPPAAEAKFKVIEESIARKLEEAKASVGNSHLALGILYAESGLFSEAEKEFVALKDENPESPVPVILLKQVKSPFSNY